MNLFVLEIWTINYHMLVMVLVCVGYNFVISHGKLPLKVMINYDSLTAYSNYD